MANNFQVYCCVLLALTAQAARGGLRREEDNDADIERYIVSEHAGLAVAGDKDSDDEDVAVMLSAFHMKTFRPHTAAEGGIPGTYVARLAGGCQGPKSPANMGRVERTLPGLRLVECTLNTTAEARELLKDPCIESVEEDLTIHFDIQVRHGSKSSQLAPPWGLDVIDGAVDGKYEATLTGRGVDVYVLDSGVDSSHAQLVGRVGRGRDYTGGRGGATRDGHGHGTHCAGTIAGTDVGVATGAFVMPYKVLSGKFGRNTWTLRALEDLVEEKRGRRRSNNSRPMLASMSLGGRFSRTTNNAVNEVVDAGVVVVVAAGNDDADASRFSPASAANVITVGALDQRERAAHFSNFGGAIDIWAPGVDVLSAKANTGDGLIKYDGTSMACPHVAGVVALLLEKNPNWSPDDVKKELLTHCSADNGNLKRSTGAKLRTYASSSAGASHCDASGLPEGGPVAPAPAPAAPTPAPTPAPRRWFWWACIAMDTPIDVSGQQQPLSALRAGDQVLMARAAQDSAMSDDGVLDISGPLSLERGTFLGWASNVKDSPELVKVECDQKSLVLTPKHFVVTKCASGGGAEACLKSADSVVVGDEVLGLARDSSQAAKEWEVVTAVSTVHSAPVGVPLVEFHDGELGEFLVTSSGIVAPIYSSAFTDISPREAHELFRDWMTEWNDISSNMQSCLSASNDHTMVMVELMTAYKHRHTGYLGDTETHIGSFMCYVAAHQGEFPQVPLGELQACEAALYEADQSCPGA